MAKKMKWELVNMWKRDLVECLVILCPIGLVLFFFFFSSRRRHTRFDCDWSSDVCSSDLVERLLQRLEQPLERVSLGEVARETIENETAAGIGFAQALADHAQHQGVLDEPATVHGFPGLAAEFGASGDGGPQQIAGRDLRDTGPLHQTLSLGALAGAGRAQQNDAHVCSVATALPRSEEHTSELQSQSN